LDTPLSESYPAKIQHATHKLAVWKNLFLFTILALSLYESESFQTPYSKLGLWQKKKTLYISLRRNNYEYIMPLNAILYEMLYFINKLPLEDSLGQQENPSA
jgi:hypothetical protein